MRASSFSTSLNQNAQITSGSKAWTRLVTGDGLNSTMVVDGELIRPSLIMIAGLPWIIASAIILFILGGVGLAITRRKTGAPFALSGILMKFSQLEAISFNVKGDAK